MSVCSSFRCCAPHRVSGSTGPSSGAASAVRDLPERDPALTITRLEEIYPVARYKNLDGFLDGLGKAGLPE